MLFTQCCTHAMVDKIRNIPAKTAFSTDYIEVIADTYKKLAAERAEILKLSLFKHKDAKSENSFASVMAMRLV